MHLATCSLSASKVKAPAALRWISHAGGSGIAAEVLAPPPREREAMLTRCLTRSPPLPTQGWQRGECYSLARAGSGSIGFSSGSLEPDRLPGKQRDGQGIRPHALQIRGPFHVIACFKRRRPPGHRSPDLDFRPSRGRGEAGGQIVRRRPAILRDRLRADDARRDLRLPAITPAGFLRDGITRARAARPPLRHARA